MRSAVEIPVKRTDNIGVRSMPKEFQHSDKHCKLHEVAPKVTFWREKADSLVLDSSRTVEARGKQTAAVHF